MRNFKTPIMAAVLASASLGFATAATAQSEPQAAAAPAAVPAAEASTTAATPAEASAAATATAAVSDEQVRQYALALAEVTKVQQAYAPKVQAATEADKPAIQSEVNAKMSAAVEAQGLDPKTFNSISQSAQQDPTLSQKIQAEFQKAQPSQ